MSRTYNWDDTFCPKGHGDWVFISQTTLYSDIYWCEPCDLFYYPAVKPMTKEKLNEQFYSDRAAELIERANFLKWRDSLDYKDMPPKGGQ